MAYALDPAATEDLVCAEDTARIAALFKDDSDDDDDDGGCCAAIAILALHLLTTNDVLWIEAGLFGSSAPTNMNTTALARMSTSGSLFHDPIACDESVDSHQQQQRQVGNRSTQCVCSKCGECNTLVGRNFCKSCGKQLVQDSDTERAIDYHAAVTKIYKTHNPEKLEDPNFVSNWLAKYANRENDFLAALKQKYKIVDADGYAPSAAPAPGTAPATASQAPAPTSVPSHGSGRRESAPPVKAPASASASSGDAKSFTGLGIRRGFKTCLGAKRGDRVSSSEHVVPRGDGVPRAW
jgi:hypothetical protein